MSKRANKFAPEVRERAVRMVLEHESEHPFRWAAITSINIHTVLTDNGIEFTTPGGGGSAVPLIKEAMAKGEGFRAHAFEYACARNDISITGQPNPSIPRPTVRLNG
jgi:hypothetical protein